MRKQITALLLIVSLGSISWSAAQGSKPDLFDLKKSRQELEIMKGILSTTLGFAANELRSRDAAAQDYERGLLHYSSFGSHITAFYLYGQGATFMIPTSSFRFASSRSGRLMTRSEPGISEVYEVSEPYISRVYERSLNESLRQVQEEMNALGHEMEAKNQEIALAAREAAEAAQSLAREAMLDQAGSVRAGVVGGVKGGVGGGVPKSAQQGAGTVQAPAPAPAPAAPVTPAKPAKPQIDKEEMRKKLEAAQAKVQKTREEMDARRQKLLESVAQMSGYLVEALANHGDSLTHVRPSEYINLIIATDEGFPMLGESSESRSQRQVISVQKSLITDYKAGRITLDVLKQKVLQYSN